MMMRGRALLFLILLVGTMTQVPLSPGNAATNASQNPITAGPPLSRPGTTSCVVFLANDQPFSKGYTPFSATYSPPPGCPAPWSRVILDWNASVAGVQFDRIGGVWLGDVEILRTSTPEPSPSGIAWHVEKDVSEYSSWFSQQHNSTIIVSNSVSKQLTGIIYVTVTVTFYETSALFPAAAHPPVVVPITATGPAGFSAPWFLLNSGDEGSKTVDLPRNLVGGYLEVYATPHSCDEAWYSNETTGYALQNGLCGGTAFREVQVLIDGVLVGAVWPFPLIYTGGWNPYLWRPIPGVNSLDIPPYVINLAPFIGLLTNGVPHTITFQVLNNFGYWRVDGNLMLYTDPGSSATAGALTTYQMQQNPSERVVETIGAFSQDVNATTPFRCPAGSVSCVFDTTATRSILVSGYVNSSLGRSTTTVQQTMSFNNRQEVNLNSGVEDISGSTLVTTTTATTNSTGKTVTTVTDSYPISMVSAYIVPNGGGTNPIFVLPVGVNQTLIQNSSGTTNGVAGLTTSVSNAIDAQAIWIGNMTSGASIKTQGMTSEHYVYSDSRGDCFDQTLIAAGGNLTSDTTGQSCG